MEGGCLGYPGHASVASQRLHRICQYSWQIPATQPWASMRHCYFLFLKIPKGALSRLSPSFNYRIYLNKRRPPLSARRPQISAAFGQEKKHVSRRGPRISDYLLHRRGPPFFDWALPVATGKPIIRFIRAKMAKRCIKCDARAKLLFC